MTQPSTYALLAAASYKDIRTLRENQVPIPAGWTEPTQYAMSSSGSQGSISESGFSARVYRGPSRKSWSNGQLATNDIVDEQRKFA